MKIHTHIFNKQILNKFYWILTFISVIFSIFSVFFNIPDKYKKIICIILITVLVISLIILFIFANIRTKIKLTINNTLLEVKIGDIFTDDSELKVIPFNEYFDTIVDNKIISSKSLNGIYINKYFCNNVSYLDKLIEDDLHSKKMLVGENIERSTGKTKKYKLGSVIDVNGYLLTAFSHFNEDDEAYLDINDYINCLLTLWNEIDRVYASKSIALPVLGTGLSRMKNNFSFNEQELLEFLIESFKISRIKFSYPAKLEIIVPKDKKDKINLTKLKYLEG